jgi:hypothetical protein
MWTVITPFSVTVPRPVLCDTQCPSGKGLVLEIVYEMYKSTCILDVRISIEIEPLYTKQLLSHYVIEKYTKKLIFLY